MDAIYYDWEIIGFKLYFLINPDYNEYYALKSNAIKSYRAIIKFEIDKSLTKYVLNTIRTRQNDFHFHFTFEDMYPDDFGFYQNLTHQLIEDENLKAHQLSRIWRNNVLH